MRQSCSRTETFRCLRSHCGLGLLFFSCICVVGGVRGPLAPPGVCVLTFIFLFSFPMFWTSPGGWFIEGDLILTFHSPLQAQLDGVMTTVLGNIQKAQQDDMKQILQGITDLRKDQAKFQELVLAHLDIKDSRARDDACRAAEEIAQIAAEGGDARKSMRKMKPHVRALASSMKSSAVIIPYNKLEFDPGEPILGRGAFGEVKEAMLDGTPVAVKQSVDGENLSNDAYMELMRESELWNSLKHPNVVLLMGVVPKPLCIVLEKLDTCVSKMIHDDGRSFSEGEVCQVLDYMFFFFCKFNIFLNIFTVVVIIEGEVCQVVDPNPNPNPNPP